jgi:hypothetical protein
VSDRAVILYTKAGNQVVASPFQDRADQKQYSVEIIKDGEVIDHYTLMGDAALDFMTKREGWTRKKR